MRLARWIPLGCDARRERNWILYGALAGALVNLRFVLAYLSARGDLYGYHGGVRELLPGAVIAPFSELLGWGLLGCYAAAAAMAALAVWHYAVHFRGSRSIYRMRLLKTHPWELLRRCLALPLLGAAVFLAEALALRLLDYLIYALATPQACLPPLGWDALWGL